MTDKDYQLAPVVLFVYNRPWHTEQTLNALAGNTLAEQSVLFIYADGPKPNASKELSDKIQEVRQLIRSKKWCKEVHIIESESNKGLANSIIGGVTEIVNEYGKIIILEDDIVTSPYFLKYMNDGLDIYENEDKVISIHAYNYPISPKGLPSTFFMKGADCWGWATWKSKWSLFEKDATKLLNYILDNNLQYEFDISGCFPYTEMLKDQISNKIDSWAIRWYASAFINNKYTLYPSITLIYNIGFDNSGVHGRDVDTFNNEIWNKKKAVEIQLSKIETNQKALKRWCKYLKKNKEENIFIKKLLKKFKGTIKKWIIK